MTCKDCRLLLGMTPASIDPALRLHVAHHVCNCADCEEWLAKKEAGGPPLTDAQIAEVKALADETIALLNGAQE